eukprot:67870_1
MPADTASNNAMTIEFADSLRLLDVKSIIHLMQACNEKNIHLPDIHKIDWEQAFQNSTNNNDVRLFSNTFDADNKSVLISIYLTGYNHDNYSILKSFVRKHDVPFNVQDGNGDTIIHHMIRRHDYAAVPLLLDLLKPNQRFHFDVRNNEGKTIIHEMIEQNNYKNLNNLLDIIRVKSNTTLNINVQDGNG